ncbi:class I adenylate-forming enzyme family protein [Paraburkholderia pallida]|uniref:AMP-dependent synthetase n=1 Tax=Paraburkholderia pallida TaxID=2547399 RepID=A0A4P7CT04_9BURK|nr:AMP-binding protein [Paraburkholderia pallida]QBQ99075.1 AMP-dependent synthetase [Paraburkholderia pallida]
MSESAVLLPGNVIDRSSRLCPEGVAIVFEGRKITYREHALRVRKLGAALHRVGVRHQDRISVLSMNRPEFVEVYGAGDVFGFVTATVNYRLAVEEIAFVLSDTAPRVVVFEEQYRETVDALRARLGDATIYVCIGAANSWAHGYEEFVASGDEQGAPFRASREDYCQLIYTSGTTGRPKGAVRSHYGQSRMAEQIAAALGLRGDSSILVTMPFFHGGARSQQVAAFLRRATVVIHRKFEAGEVLREIARSRISHMHLAPTMFQAVMDHPEFSQHDISSVRGILYAAAPMPVPLLRRGLAAFGSVFINSYGMTETNGTVLFPHQHHLEGTAVQVRRLGSVGQVADGGELRVVDDEGHPCPPGVPGEVCVKSDTQFRLYWNNSVATAEAVRDGWYHTGDIGYLDEEEFLFLVDRKKDMIISGGENIYCREVEDALESHEGVEEAAVIGVPDAYWGEVVHAVIVLRRDRALSASDLIEFCRARIAHYKCPKGVSFVTELPRLPTGKVSKIRLRASHAAATRPSTSGDTVTARKGNSI